MTRGQEFMSRISALLLHHPEKIAVSASIAVIYPVFLYTPYWQYQPQLWGLVAVTYVVGDSITTGLLGKYELPEGGALTRRICGIHPTFRCAAATRVVFFSGVFVFYLSLRQFVDWVFLARVVHLIPVVMSALAGAAVIINTHGILLAQRGEFSEEESL